MNEMQAKLDAIEVEGVSGGGLVKVRASAKGRILRVEIDESLMKPEEQQMVEDLVTAAFNDARDKADRTEEHTSELQPLMRSSYAVLCLPKYTRHTNNTHNKQATHHN